MNSEEVPGKVTPYSMKNFIRRLNNAAVRKKYRDDQLSEIGQRVFSMSTMSSEEPGSSSVNEEIRKMGLKLRENEEEERTIMARQRTEQNEMDNLRGKIAMLEEKIEALSHVHSMINHAHEEKISELQFALRKAGGSIPETTPEQELHKFVLEKVKPAEDAKKVKIIVEEDAYKGKKKKIPVAVIKSLKKKISDAEKMHAKLKKKGYPKDDLDRLRVMIDLYKERLSRISG